MPFFTVNFDLKTKMPSTVINKKIIKLIYLKKKKTLKEKGWWQPPLRWPGGLRATPKGGSGHL